MKQDQVIQTIKTYDTIADFYAASMDTYTPEVDRKLFLSYLAPSSMILDVGSAAGRDSIFFTQQGHKTIGIDLSQKLLAIARYKAPSLTFIHDDIRKKIFPNESFDAVWACAVLLHLPRADMPHVLENFYNVLVANGLLLIRVKEGEGEGDVVEKLSKNQSRHFTYYTLHELEHLIKSAGFQILHTNRSNEKDIDPMLRDLWWITVIAKKTTSI